MTVPFNFLILSSSTVGTTIVVDITVIDVVTIVTVDAGASEMGSDAMPSESYCERAIDGTTRRNQINIDSVYTDEFRISVPLYRILKYLGFFETPDCNDIYNEFDEIR